MDNFSNETWANETDEDYINTVSDVDMDLSEPRLDWMEDTLPAWDEEIEFNATDVVSLKRFLHNDKTT